MAGVVLLAASRAGAGRAAAALGAAAVLLLLVDPALIDDAGFRLSVLATAGLLAWAHPTGTWLGGPAGGACHAGSPRSSGSRSRRRPPPCRSSLATFGRLSLVSPAVNLTVVPLVPVAMARRRAGCWQEARSPPSGRRRRWAPSLGCPAGLVLHVVVALVRIGAAVPFAASRCRPRRRSAAAAIAGVVVVAAPGAAGPASTPACTTAACDRPATSSRAGRGSARAAHAAAALVAGASLVALGGAALGDATGRAYAVTVLDVGQGDAILVETRTGARMLVDGGPDPDRVLVALDDGSRRGTAASTSSC